ERSRQEGVLVLASLRNRSRDRAVLGPAARGPPAHASELVRKLLRQRVRQSVGDDVDVALHGAPGRRFLFVLTSLDLLDLLQMVAAVGEQQLLKRVLWQVRIGA